MKMPPSTGPQKVLNQAAKYYIQSRKAGIDRLLRCNFSSLKLLGHFVVNLLCKLFNC